MEAGRGRSGQRRWLQRAGARLPAGVALVAAGSGAGVGKGGVAVDKERKRERGDKRINLKLSAAPLLIILPHINKSVQDANWLDLDRAHNLYNPF